MGINGYKVWKILVGIIGETILYNSIMGSDLMHGKSTHINKEYLSMATTKRDFY